MPLTIQLRNIDDSHRKYLTQSEAKTMWEKGLVSRSYSKKSNRLVLRMLPEVAPSESESTACSITFEDMLAFVGIGPAPVVAAARRKVERFNPASFGYSAPFAEVRA